MAVTFAPSPTTLPAAYAEADSKLQGRCAQRRKIANNTYLERRGEDIALRLHQTDVVTFHTDGTATFDTGGWFSMTTKSRMNDALPRGIVLSSIKGRWFFTYPGHWDGDTLVPSERKAVPYADGIRLDLSTLTVVGGEVPAEQVKAEDDANTAMRKAVNTYIRKTTPEDIVRAFDNAGSDCVICRWPGRETEADHLRQHVEEQYVMVTLLHNAVTARGFRYPSVILDVILSNAQHGKVDSFYRDSIRKYLRKHLAVGAVATK